MIKVFCLAALRYDRMFASRPVVDDQFDEEGMLMF